MIQNCSFVENGSYTSNVGLAVLLKMGSYSNNDGLASLNPILA